MTPDAPHVAVGIDVDHVLAAAHHVVDVVDLERDVVREGDRRRLDGEVVVDLTAAGEGDDALHLIADLEADHVGEECKRRGLVGCAVHDVGEIRRCDRFGSEHTLGGDVPPFGRGARPVERVVAGR